MPNEDVKSFCMYRPVADEQLFNEEFVDAQGEAAQLVNNTLLCYAQSGRVQQNIIQNLPTDTNEQDIVIDVPAGRMKNVLNMVLAGKMTGAGRRVKAWLYMKTDASNKLDLNLQCGRHAGIEEDVESTSFIWRSIEIDCDQVDSITLKEDRRLRLNVYAGDSDVQLTVRSWAVHELGKDGEPDSVLDVSTGVMGTVDYPYTAGMTKIINDNIRACYAQRLPRSNLSSHCVLDSKTLSGAYDGDERGLGMYVIRKAAGVDTITVKKFVFSNGSTGQVDIKVGLYTTAGAAVASDTHNLVPPAAEWDSFTFSGLSTDETEYEIRIDAKLSSGDATTCTIPNIFTCDEPDGSEVTHLLPNKSNTQNDDDVLALTWAKLHPCLKEIWDRKTQISLNDFRRPTVKISGETYTVLTRGVVFPSWGSRHLICRALVYLPPKEQTGHIELSGVVGGFSIGEIVQGGTSGATGYVVYYYSGTPKYVSLIRINGNFSDGETLTGITSGGTATAASTIYDPTTTVGLKFMIKIWDDFDDYTTGLGDILQEQEIILSDRPHGQGLLVEFRLPIPSEYWNDHTDYGTYTGPLTFSLVTTPSPDGDSVDTVDHVILRDASVFEEVPATL